MTAAAKEAVQMYLCRKAKGGKSTIIRLAKGGTPMKDFGHGKLLLTNEEEDIVTNCILDKADEGLPLTRNEVPSNITSSIVWAHDPSFEEVGRMWMGGVLICPS
jgi:hypothetical protein